MKWVGRGMQKGRERKKNRVRREDKGHGWERRKRKIWRERRGEVAEEGNGEG